VPSPVHLGGASSDAKLTWTKVPQRAQALLGISSAGMFLKAAKKEQVQKDSEFWRRNFLNAVPSESSKTTLL